ncbi:MAG: MlaD family protein [bacterium]
MYNYRKQLSWSKLRVGLVITTALVIIFITIMFSGILEKFFSQRIIIYATFSNVQGLRGGAPVWFSGIEIGTVRSIDLTYNNGEIKVALAINPSTLKYLQESSTATISTLGLLGDKYIEIQPGTAKAKPLRPGETIKGTFQVEFQNIVKTSEESIKKLTEFVNNLDRIIIKLEESQGTMAKFFQDPSLYNNLNNMTQNLSKIIKRIETGNGTLGNLVADQALYENLSESSKSLNTFVQQLSVKKGTLNRLILDESLYNNLNAFAEKINKVSRELDRGEGLLGSLITDKELKKDFKMTLNELNSLLKDIRENPDKYFKFSLF